MNDVTLILSAAERLLALVYTELRRIAAQKLVREKPGQTLDVTGLVHEAYVRLFGDLSEQQHWDSRSHFFTAAVEAMRRILIDNARRKKPRKHDGDRQRVALLDEDLAIHDSSDELLALDGAIAKLVLEDATSTQLLSSEYSPGCRSNRRPRCSATGGQWLIDTGVTRRHGSIARCAGIRPQSTKVF